MGLIGIEFDDIIFHLTESTNSIAVQNFFLELIPILKDPSNTIIVLDNHSAHGGTEVQTIFKDSGM